MNRTGLGFGCRGQRKEKNRRGFRHQEQRREKNRKQQSREGSIGSSNGKLKQIFCMKQREEEDQEEEEQKGMKEKKLESQGNKDQTLFRFVTDSVSRKERWGLWKGKKDLPKEQGKVVVVDRSLKKSERRWWLEKERRRADHLSL